MQAQAEKRAGFDRVAGAYRWLEYCSFGRSLERCRGLRLDTMDTARHALVLGDGDGRFTAALLARHSGVCVAAVDSSAEMLRLLSARVERMGASARLRPVQGEAVALLRRPHAAGSGDALEGRGFDHICSHFFLDCLSSAEVERLVDNVCPRLTSEAAWIVSEFAAPSWWTHVIVALLYRAFGWLTGLETQQLPKWREALLSRGFTCIADTSLLGGLLSSTIWRKAGNAGM